jgi:DNA-binding PadR family transcriptional regulator
MTANMPPVKSAVKTKRRPLRQWITDVLGETGPLTTTKLRKKVAEKSGAKYHMNSMYLALRSLKKSGAISATRKGRQRFYALGRAVEAAAVKAERRVVARVEAVKVGRPKAVPAAVVAAAPAAASAPAMVQSFPHRLAMGEIAIVAVEDGTLLSATNVHGELVLKRHPLPPS